MTHTHEIPFAPNFRKGVLWAMLTASMWGLLSIGLKVASGLLDSTTLVWLRFVLAFGIMSLYYLIRSPRSLLSLFHQGRGSVLAGVFLACNYFTYMKGVELVSPSNAQLFIQAGPILLVVMGVVLFKERMGWSQLIGLLISACGFILFFRDQLHSVVTGADLYRTGALWILCAAVFWASFAAYQKVLMGRGVNPQQLNFFIYGMSALAFLPAANVGAVATIPIGMWPLILFLGVNTLIAYGGLAEAFKHTPASVVSIIITTNPVATLMVMSVLSFFEVTWVKPEIVHTQGWVGAFAVIAGACLVARKPKRRKKKNLGDEVAAPV